MYFRCARALVVCGRVLPTFRAVIRSQVPRSVQQPGSAMSAVSCVSCTDPPGALAYRVLLEPDRRGPDVLVLFPGDQPSPEALPEDKQWLLDPEQQLQVVAAKFPACHALLVMPARLHEGCFACFDQFLRQTTLTGEPMGYKAAGFKALLELQSLLSTYLPTGAPIGEVTLVGFSKSCVVLNQVLAELAALEEARSGSSESAVGVEPPASTVSALADKVVHVHYLDAGLNCRGAYTTDPHVATWLGALAAGREFTVCLHGTPRQWDDPSRPWLPAERARMVQLLRAAGLEVQEQLYFEGTAPSLLQHMEILAAMQLL